LVTTGFFGILIGMMTGQFVTKDSPELLLLVGSLATAWGMVISFYFGSSAGSQAKDSTIRAMQK
jgi:membrane protein DedA with SNARE-associated domain